MKNPRKAGARHPLLIYHRVMNRLWASTLVLGLLMLAIWGWAWFGNIQILDAPDNLWLAVGAGVALAFSLFTFVAHNMAYVQARQDHLRLITPFLHLRISYRRVRSIHPADFLQLYPPAEASWAQRRLFEPFYGMTVVVVELLQYPVARTLLRLFLAPQMFSRQGPGFVLLVRDWMALSTELDSLRGSWMQTQGRQRAEPGRWR